MQLDFVSSPLKSSWSFVIVRLLSGPNHAEDKQTTTTLADSGSGQTMVIHIHIRLLVQQLTKRNSAIELK